MRARLFFAALVVTGERRGKAVEEKLGSAALQEHIGKRAQRGRVVDVRWKVNALQ